VSPNVKRYLELLKQEHQLRVQVIKTQSSDIEDERIKVALERENLLFELNDEELAEVSIKLVWPKTSSPSPTNK
jgi:hypothetical protein